MAITILTGGTQAGGTNNGGSVTLTFPTLAEGDVVVVFGGHNAVSGQSAIPGGYTTIYDSGAANPTPHFGISYKVMGSTPDANVVCPGDGSGSDGTAYGCYCLRGVDVANIQDATRTVAGPTTSTNPDCPSITTATDGAVVLALALDHLAGTGDVTITAPSGYNNLRNARGADNNDATIGGATFEKASFGTEDPASFTGWTAGTWRSATLAIRPTVATALPAADPLAVGAPVFGTPVITAFAALVATDVATGAPAVDTVALGQEHALLTDADLATAALALDTPAIVIESALLATEIVVASPVIDAAPLGQDHALSTVDLTAQAPTCGTPELSSSAPSELWLGDRVLDYGLNALADADAILICSDTPTTYAEAVALALGTADTTFGAPTAGTPAGRVSTSTPITDAPVATGGTPTCWAAVDSANSRLLAVGPADGFAPVTPSVAWSLGAIPIHVNG